jgi:hypothetical protein
MGTAMDLGAWLRSLGLERYEAVFRENEINERVLPKLTAEDLMASPHSGIAVSYSMRSRHTGHGYGWQGALR